MTKMAGGAQRSRPTVHPVGPVSASATGHIRKTSHKEE
ncbi:hypothetical protein CSC02_3917 [Enterobacter hormaechei subsp. hoffmannii]|nr:hypothetical protein CSC02_3917 [Enterobacter hormaechei subsp. hoffmannii]